MGSRAGIGNKPRANLKGKPCSMAFLFRCMEDQGLEIRDRIDCAKAILPYQHQKLPTRVENADGTPVAINLIIR